MNQTKATTPGQYADVIRWQIDKTLRDLSHAEQELKKLFDVLSEMERLAADVNYIPTPFRGADPVLVEVLVDGLKNGRTEKPTR